MTKDRIMVGLKDTETNGGNEIVCPYCGEKNHFLNCEGEPKIVKKCPHLTSLFMQAASPEELKYCYYARFKAKE